MYRVGIDVGGTFTDLVAVDDAGRTVLEKVPTRPTTRRSGCSTGSSGSRARPAETVQCC
ncbi:MAG TPA: hydantoinase/oxoprolinase N-terminal domain-containing protein [Stellaceae bacterium]|jgi:N-methylhydantoinase A|nr:hydantoinase/oxoprolinase N-terminal domain-containing protein [Stellaceae bacterium]